jgi:hypothetical protein
MEPFMRRMVAPNGQVWWVVEGLGMAFAHRQRWQAEVKLHYLQSSVGVSTTEGPPRDLESTPAADETN